MEREPGLDVLSQVASLCEIIAIMLALTGSEELAGLAQLLAHVLRLVVADGETRDKL